MEEQKQGTLNTNPMKKIEKYMWLDEEAKVKIYIELA